MNERERSEQVQRLLAQGADGLEALLGMRTDPSWGVRREVIAALGALGALAVPPLCESLIRERDDETRIAATVDALVGSNADVEQAVWALASDPSAAVLADVAQILGRRRNPLSVPALAALSRHADDNVAVAAIEGLGRIGGRAVVDVLVEAVESTRFFRTFAAIDVLGRSGDPRAIAPLSALLDSTQYAFEAARALGRTSDRAAVAPLARLLVSPLDANVRVAALGLAELHERYVQRFGTGLPVAAAVRNVASDLSVRRLERCLHGADEAEQIAICFVLGAMQTEAAAHTVTLLLDAAPGVAKAAAQALRHMGSQSEAQLQRALREGSSARRQALLPNIVRQSALGDVLSCLQDPEGAVRQLACEALARLGTPSAVPALFDLLGDRNPAVVQAAIAAIQALGAPETPALAISAAASPTSTIRRAALRILAYVGHDEALPLFVRSTRDSDARVREVAIQGLAFLELPRAVTALLELGLDPSPQIRAVALRALGDLGDGRAADPTVVAALLRGLHDTDAWVRYYACQSLGKLAVEASVEELSRCIEDTAGQVRVAAIEALSHLGSDVAFASLERATASSNVDIQRAAVVGLGLSRRKEALPVLASFAAAEDSATRLVALSALANFPGPETLPALEHALQDTDPNVRSAALGFLSLKDGVEATRLLSSLLRDPVLSERALAALSVPREHRVVGLLSLLQTADDDTALHLARCLARLNQPDASAALFEALRLPNAPARKAAATTLAALGSRDAFATLRRMSIEDPDHEIRRVATLLLVG